MLEVSGGLTATWPEISTCRENLEGDEIIGQERQHASEKERKYLRSYKQEKCQHLLGINLLQDLA